MLGHALKCFCVASRSRALLVGKKGWLLDVHRLLGACRWFLRCSRWGAEQGWGDSRRVGIPLRMLFVLASCSISINCDKKCVVHPMFVQEEG